MAPLQHGFVHDGLRIAACEWGDPAGLPVLALHGWLDNCGSFAPLGRLLRGVRLVALDLPGHGHSDHRSADGTYNIWQDVGVVHSVAEQLGWERFGLLGHSRGAMICTLAAGTFPERVSHLGLLDSFVPGTVATAEQPEQLRRAILERAARRERAPRVYPDLDALAATRLRGPTPLSARSTPDILARGAEVTAGGWRWRSDEKLKLASEIKLTPELVRAFVERIDCPILLLLSDLARRSRFYGMEAHARDLEIAEVPGGHHFHMEEPAPEVARRLERFFAAAPAA
ncbi:MAG: alpha/beta fold hydrolase [Pseudomonadota bacterium]|jgi:pimeloyl-ACP methyl ester carboxylesterase